jgi:hypothetical protein
LEIWSLARYHRRDRSSTYGVGTLVSVGLPAVKACRFLCVGPAAPPRLETKGEEGVPAGVRFSPPTAARRKAQPPSRGGGITRPAGPLALTGLYPVPRCNRSRAGRPHPIRRPEERGQLTASRSSGWGESPSPSAMPSSTFRRNRAAAALAARGRGSLRPGQPGGRAAFLLEVLRASKTTTTHS